MSDEINYEIPKTVILGGVEYEAPNGFLLVFKNNTLFTTPANTNNKVTKLYEVDWTQKNEAPTFYTAMEKRNLIPVGREVT